MSCCHTVALSEYTFQYDVAAMNEMSGCSNTPILENTLASGSVLVAPKFPLYFSEKE